MLYFYIGTLKIILNKKRLKRNVIKLLRFSIILLCGLFVLKVLHITFILGYLIMGLISYITSNIIDHLNILIRE